MLGVNVGSGKIVVGNSPVPSVGKSNLLLICDYKRSFYIVSKDDMTRFLMARDMARHCLGQKRNLFSPYKASGL